MSSSTTSIPLKMANPASASPASEQVSVQSWKLQIAVLAAIALIGALYLPQPFYDDQALFAIGAKKMSHGQVLYRDYWDIKQPGIFIFYLAAGELFGFTEAGIHGFELFYLLVLSWLLMRVLGCYYQGQRLALLVPLLTVGWYYGVSGITQLGQVEGLVCFPMFLCLWLACSAMDHGTSRGARLVLSGLMGGVVLLFKLMFLLIIVSFWINVLLHKRRRDGRSSLLPDTAAILTGIMIPLLITFAYFERFGVLQVVYDTFFVYPVRAVVEYSQFERGKLIDGGVWFINRFAPLLGLAFVGAWASLRRTRDLLTTSLVLWFITGLAVILLQRLSWYRYHYMLLFLPVGLLAVKGIEVLWRELNQNKILPEIRLPKTVIVIGLALLFSPVISSVLVRALVLARYHLALNQQQRLRYQSDQFLYPDSLYPGVLAETKFLSQRDSVPGKIYVIGSPLFYFLSGREEAIPYSGGFEHFLPEQWRRLGVELVEAKPAYIFVGATDREQFKREAPEAERFIEANYRLFRSDDAGTWYVLAEIPPVNAGSQNIATHSRLQPPQTKALRVSSRP
jgi:hypothetical protein